MRQGKKWGYTTEIFRNATVSVHRLEIKRGGYCSEHKHAHKYNLFHVLRGRLEITIWRKESLVDITELTAGQSSAIPPGFYHKFRGLEETDCLEIYQVLLIGEDIKRRKDGGI